MLRAIAAGAGMLVLLRVRIRAIRAEADRRRHHNTQQQPAARKQQKRRRRRPHRHERLRARQEAAARGGIETATVAPADDGARLLQFLRAHFAATRSKRRAHRACVDGRVRVNDGAAAAEDSRVLRAGDVVRLDTRAAAGAGAARGRAALARAGIVLAYADAHVAVVYKPAGRTVGQFDRTGVRERPDTVVAALRPANAGGLLPPGSDAAAPSQVLPRPWVANRLPKGVSGLIVAARTEPCRRWLLDGGEKAGGVLARHYRAILHGDWDASGEAAGDGLVWCRIYKGAQKRSVREKWRASGGADAASADASAANGAAAAGIAFSVEDVTRSNSSGHLTTVASTLVRGGVGPGAAKRDKAALAAAARARGCPVVGLDRRAARAWKDRGALLALVEVHLRGYFAQPWHAGGTDGGAAAAAAVAAAAAAAARAAAGGAGDATKPAAAAVALVGDGRTLAVRVPEPRKFAALRRREQRHWAERQAKIRAELVAHGGLDGAALDAAAARLAASGEPVAYAVGSAPFCGRRFAVEKGVFVPRPSSAALVEQAVRAAEAIDAAEAADGAAGDGGMARAGSPKRVLDLGTGSGALLLSTLARLPPAWTGVGVDASPDAVRVARANAASLGLGARAAFVEADFGRLRAAVVATTDSDPAFDVVICNPPYASAGENKGRRRGHAGSRIAASVKAHEPAAALFAEEDGLAAYRVVAEQLCADGVLAAGSWARAVFEVGAGQGDAVASVVARASGGALKLASRHDDANALERCLVFRRRDR